MEIDKFAHLASPIHCWDTRWKVASLIILIFIFASVQRMSALVFMPVIALGIFFITRLPLGFMLQTLKAPLVFLGLMSPFLIFTAGGKAVYHWGFLSIYQSGWFMVIRVMIKSTSIMLLFVTLFGTAELNKTMKALRFFLLPSALLSIFLFTYRYIFLYLADKDKLFTAATLRGFNRKNSLGDIKTTISLLINLLIRSFEQSERTYSAMRLRGFKGDFNTVDDFTFTWTDALKGFMCLVLGLLMITLESL
jgi:cobalt/nickel transport system permease protein